MGRSRGGFGTKLHLALSRTGVPLAATLTPGEKSECQQVGAVLREVHVPHTGLGRRRTRPHVLAGDKGYSFPTVRRYLRTRGIRAVIPTRSNQRSRPHINRVQYRARNIIERVVGLLKESRRLATRFEKLAVNFLAMVKLAMLQRYLRLLHSSDRA